jgi:hypothetical protein
LSEDDVQGRYATAGPVQRLWQEAEALHAVTYFDRRVRRAVRAAGAPGFWAGYMGTRLAPLRTADPSLATAVLYVFAPRMVAEHLPAPGDAVAWDAGRRAALREVLAGYPVPAEAWEAAAAALRDTLAACDVGARPLFAAHAGLPWPDDPVLATWHGTTLLREYRGDGHLHVLAGAGLSGCAAMVLALRWRGQGGAADETAAADRGWRPGEVEAAYAALGARGWVGADRALTEAGAAARAAIEADTDRRALPASVGPPAVERLVAALAPLAVHARPTIPAANPIGVTGEG